MSTLPFLSDVPLTTIKIKAPRIDSFHFPTKSAIKPGILIGLSTLLHLAPLNSPSPLLVPLNFIRQYIPPKAWAFNFYAIFGIHALESLYTLSLCLKHSTGVLVGVSRPCIIVQNERGLNVCPQLQYVGATFIFGMPIWASLRKRIQSARIDSVMKIQ